MWPNLEFFPTLHWVSHFFISINIVCCGYLIQSGAFEILVQVMLMWCGPAFFFYIFWIFSEYFFEASLKLNLTIQILLKNHEERHPTSTSTKMWGLSYKGLNLSWTNSQCIFCMNVTATSITYLDIIGTSKLGIGHWQIASRF